MNISLYQPSALEEAYGVHLLQTAFGINTTTQHFRIAGRQAVPFLSQSGVDRQVLRNIWTVVDPENVGHLAAPLQFFTLLRLVALAQAGLVLDSSSVPAMQQCLYQTSQLQVPLAVFEGIPVPDQATLHQVYLQHKGMAVGSSTPLAAVPPPQVVDPLPTTGSYPASSLAGASTTETMGSSDMFISLGPSQSQQPALVQSDQTLQLESIEDAFAGLVEVQDAPLPTLAPNESVTLEHSPALVSDDDDFGDFACTENAPAETTPQPVVTVQQLTSEQNAAPTTNSLLLSKAVVEQSPTRDVAPVMIREQDDFGEFAGNHTQPPEENFGSNFEDTVTSSKQDDVAAPVGMEQEAPSLTTFGAFTPKTTDKNNPGWDALDALVDIPDAPLPGLGPLQSEPSLIEQQQEGGGEDETEFGDFEGTIEENAATITGDSNVQPTAGSFGVFGGPPAPAETTTGAVDSEPFGAFDGTKDGATVPDGETLMQQQASIDAAISLVPPTEQSTDQAFGWDALDALGSVQDAPLPSLETLSYEQPVKPTATENLVEAAALSLVSLVAPDEAAASEEAPGQHEVNAMANAPDAPPSGLTSLSFEHPTDHAEATAGSTGSQPGVDSTVVGVTVASGMDVRSDARNVDDDFGDFVSGGEEEKVQDSMFGTNRTEAEQSNNIAFAGNGDVGEGENTSNRSTVFRSTESSFPAISNQSGVDPVEGGASIEPPQRAVPERVDSAYYSAHGTSGSNMSEDFEDALQFPTSEKSPGQNSDSVQLENSAMKPNRVSSAFGGFSPSAPTEDPFSAFDTLAAPAPDLKPLSSFGADAINVEQDVGDRFSLGETRSSEEADQSGSPDKNDKLDDISAVLTSEKSSNMEQEVNAAADVVTSEDGMGDFAAFSGVQLVSSPQEAQTGASASQDDDFGDFSGFGENVAVPDQMEGLPQEEDLLVDSAVNDTLELAEDRIGATPATETSHVETADDESFGDFGDFNGTETAEFAEDSGSKADTPRKSIEQVQDRNNESDAFEEFASFNDFESAPTPSAQTSEFDDAETKNLIAFRDYIKDLSLQLPEAIRRQCGDSGDHVSFCDVFDANIGLEIPVSDGRKKRIQRCIQVMSLLCTTQTKLASTYWSQTFAVARDELSMASTLLEEAAALPPGQKDKVRKHLETYLQGLGEFVRVCRSIAATIGDLLMLDPSSLLTIDTLTSSWCSIALLNEYLAIEQLWKNVEELASAIVIEAGATNLLETVTDVRTLVAQGPSTEERLCYFTLQPLSLSAQSLPTKTPVNWNGKPFMACAANFLANKCAFYAPTALSG